MKKLNKAWWNAVRQTAVLSDLRICEKADEYDEELFEALFKKELAKFTERERDEIDDSICHIVWAKKYDNDFIKKRFIAKLDARISLAYCLPEELLKKIPDLRVLCLGYATEPVINAAEKYRTELFKYCYGLDAAVETATEKLSKEVGIDINFTEFCGAIVKSIKDEGNDLVIDFECGLRLRMVGARIKEQEKLPLEWNDADPYSQGTSLVSCELYKAENGVDVYLMMKDFDELDNERLWYITVFANGLSNV